MLIKKKAIINKTKFNRIYLDIRISLCYKCPESHPTGYRSQTDICDLCDKVLWISGLSTWDTKFGYIPIKK